MEIRNKRFVRLAGVGVALAAVLGSLTACGSQEVNVGADNYVCIYDEAGTLKKQLPPNSKQEQTSKDDTIVKIPMSNRFYNVTTDDTTRDGLAPKTYNKSLAQGGVAMDIQGKIRFRFNAAKACEWYDKHGRRNATDEGDLNFNPRVGDTNSGWLVFLAKNFGEVMSTTTTEVVPNYTWEKLYYNSPVNADASGTVPAGTTPGDFSRLALGMELGTEFTKNLKESLGGDYFCGVSGEGECPEMTFEVLDARPQKAELVEAADRVDQIKRDADLATREAELNRTNTQAQVDAEAAKQRILDAQIATADRQALVKTAECRVLGQMGLDCQGNRPGVYQLPATAAPAPQGK